MSDLKACPFCGKEVKIKKECHKDWTGKIYKREYHIACGCGISTKKYDTEDKAAKAWNRRPYESKSN